MSKDKDNNEFNNKLDSLLNDIKEETDKELMFRAFIVKVSLVAGLILCQEHGFEITKSEFSKLTDFEQLAIQDIIDSYIKDVD